MSKNRTLKVFQSYKDTYEYSGVIDQMKRDFDTLSEAYMDKEEGIITTEKEVIEYILEKDVDKIKDKEYTVIVTYEGKQELIKKCINF